MGPHCERISVVESPGRGGIREFGTERHKISVSRVLAQPLPNHIAIEKLLNYSKKMGGQNIVYPTREENLGGPQSSSRNV